MLGDLIFRQLFDKRSSTYSYLLADSDSREGVIIDPVKEQVDRDVSLIRELDLTIRMAVNTHCHADHITGTRLLREEIGSLSMISTTSGAKADRYFDHGDVIRFGSHSLGVRATPGHTNGCSSLVLDNDVAVFTGDAVLIRGCGRTDFQEGDSRMLYKSVHEQIFTLPDSCLIFPAHDYKGRSYSTVGEEKKFNPRLSKSEEEFIGIMSQLNLRFPRMIDIAVPANLMCDYIGE